MSLGKRKSNASDSFLPFIKYDARTGDMVLQDREQNSETGEWKNKQRDVTAAFRAAIDLENLEVGWIRFNQQGSTGNGTGSSRQGHRKSTFRRFQAGTARPHEDVAQPRRRCSRIMSTAAALWDGVSALHDDYLRDAPDHPGELPVVVLAETRPKKTGNSTNYTPIFEITDWIQRPADLPGPMPRSASPAKPKQDELPLI